jgi:hypothetical protein
LLCLLRIFATVILNNIEGFLITSTFFDGVVHGLFMGFSFIFSMLNDSKAPFLYYQSAEYNQGIGFGVFIMTILIYTVQQFKYKKTT